MRWEPHKAAKTLGISQSAVFQPYCLAVLHLPQRAGIATACTDGHEPHQRPSGEGPFAPAVTGKRVGASSNEHI